MLTVTSRYATHTGLGRNINVSVLVNRGFFRLHHRRFSYLPILSNLCGDWL
jgi:hypothetical protein